MNRRDFLKLSGAVAVTGAVAPELFARTGTDAAPKEQQVPYYRQDHSVPYRGERLGYDADISRLLPGDIVQWTALGGSQTMAWLKESYAVYKGGAWAFYMADWDEKTKQGTLEASGEAIAENGFLRIAPPPDCEVLIVKAIFPPRPGEMRERAGMGAEQTLCVQVRN